MFNTNDIYEDSIKESSLHAQEVTEANSAGVFLKFLILLGLVVLAYFGSRYYQSTSSVDTVLVVEAHTTKRIDNKEDLLYGSSEAEYIKALKEIESELNDDRANISVDTTDQFDLSLAMRNIVDGSPKVDTSSYTQKLREEIGASKKITQRTIVVQKGDTLESISNKFYGNAMSYRRIIASNDTLQSKDSLIYEGQVIKLPY